MPQSAWTKGYSIQSNDTWPVRLSRTDAMDAAITAYRTIHIRRFRALSSTCGRRRGLPDYLSIPNSCPRQNIRESRVESQAPEPEGFDSVFSPHSVASPLRLGVSARDFLRRSPKILVVFVPRPVVGKSRVESRETTAGTEGGKRKAEGETRMAGGGRRFARGSPPT